MPGQPDEAPRRGVVRAQNSIFQNLKNVLRDGKRFAAELAQMIGLEGRLAVQSAIYLAGSVLAVTLLLTSSWLFLLAALAAGFHSMGLSWIAALALVAVINLVACVPLFYKMRAWGRNLSFPYTRAQMRRTDRRAEHG